MTDPKSISLTEGPVNSRILLFTGPLIVGNLFQQLYSTTDAFIVGNYVGSNALAAIGASAQIINLFIGFIIGLTTGAGIIIAQYYGALNHSKLHQAIHTSFWFCIIGGVLVSAAGCILSPSILSSMNTPAQVIPDATLYLRIYFLGTIFSIIYNMGAGTLQAVGDTRHPLYYLCISSAVNVVLVILFVTVFHLAVLGAALATLIAQFVAAFCVIRQLCCTNNVYQLKLSEIRYNKEMLIKILKFGIPTGLQSAITSFSNVIVQSYLNSFGSLAMAGNNIYSKLDGFALLPVNCLSLTATTFIAQNIGARKYDRVKKGFSSLLLLGNSYSIFIGCLLCFFSRLPLRLFTSDPAVIHYGVMMGQVLGPGYFLLVTCQILIGTARGAGDTLNTMLLSILNLCLFRIIWLTVMIPNFRSIYILYLGYPITWGSAVLCMTVYYYKRIRPRLRENEVLNI
ncbi:MATE family efflux transporter [Anaerocolumna sp. MB42-C2]|uniref:MATE family efflux transporter n=1 Tax=Anaerocolumna sp. MB42-C2 TaxID=3070997 RepID=UPI0027E1A13B|nr:MATE family efflux transporter [Anaerocolumna sp. MB42-C2]WMJ87458.1 MATE family efflux transporter [Anaerocolumna sp. MB42-C2]